MLGEAWERAASGRGDAICLVGEPGIGKSRLAYELQRHLGLPPPVEGAAQAYARGAAYFAFRPLLRQLAALSPDADLAAARERAAPAAVGSVARPGRPTCRMSCRSWAHPARRLAMPTGHAGRRTSRPRAGGGGRVGGSRVPSGAAPGADRGRPLARSIVGGPVPSAGHGRARASAAPAHDVAAAARRQSRSRWPASGRFGSGHWRPRTSTALVDAQLDPYPARERLRRAVAERAQGNPFYAEELVRAFRERGDLVLADGAYDLTADAAAVVPPTLHALIAARIDRLPPSARDLIADAAVLGKRFLLAHLRALTPGEQFDEDLALLERRGLLDREAGGGIAMLSFHHVLTQEVAYGDAAPGGPQGASRAGCGDDRVAVSGPNRGGLRPARPPLGSERSAGRGAALPGDRRRRRGAHGRQPGGDQPLAERAGAGDRPRRCRHARTSGTRSASSWPACTSSSASADARPSRPLDYPAGESPAAAARPDRSAAASASPASLE